ncbi:MAG: pyridoxal-phosphate dependent enzyme [Oscillibacter sp.]|jgi:1-aminocyclopropane-1-carboxylate deaminase/D-cysteine desulfhydrase-like pyridoxal-dependent ACC family enzyme|nr:pyridoxal-phosphate dependent enzyme [Oscillibacter sp.]
MKIENLKKAQVGYVNTPLEKMSALSEALGKGNLYIKRDDMTGLALGGNKARKLDYIVQFALDNGYTALMTFGGVQTNHGRLTVAAAVRFGLKPILVLKGAKPDYMSGNLLLDRLMGADIYFVDTTAADKLPEEQQAAAKKKFLDECTEKIVAQYEAKGEKVLNIPIGGQTVIGSAGYIQAIPEIMRQMKEQNIQAKHLVVGYGSTGTFAGLWAGAKYYHAPFEVIGIPIEPDYRPVNETVDFINELSRTFELGFTCKEEDLHLEMGGEGSDFYGGVGYNEPDHTTQSYIEMLAKTEAIFADPCYTGKVLHGFVDLLERGVIPAGDGAILMHTGGAPGLWTKEHLDSMQETYWSDETTDHVCVMKL